MNSPLYKHALRLIEGLLVAIVGALLVERYRDRSNQHKALVEFSGDTDDPIDLVVGDDGE